MKTNHKKFKRDDSVLVKSPDDRRWYSALYLYFVGKYHVTSYVSVDNDEDILPYEGNEHLVGKVDEPDGKVKLEKGEHLYVFNDKRDFPNNLSFSRFYYATKGSIKTFNGINAIHACWNYAIRFKDFDPSNMEETRKRILCVRNGKIIKYKND